MAKITLNPITGSYASVTSLNALFQLIEDTLKTEKKFLLSITPTFAPQPSDVIFVRTSALGIEKFSPSVLPTFFPPQKNFCACPNPNFGISSVALPWKGPDGTG